MGDSPDDLGNFLLNDRYVKGESTLWPIYWVQEKDASGSDILVPFYDFCSYEPVERWRIISLQDGATFSIGEIAQTLRDDELPYDLDMELLRAAIKRAGFRFRHVLLTDHFFSGDYDPRLISWVLVHICENTDLRAHRFVIFFPCHGDQQEDVGIAALGLFSENYFQMRAG